MIIKLLLTTFLSGMVLAAACGGGEVGTTDSPTPIEQLDPTEAYVNNLGVGLQILQGLIVGYDESIRLDPQNAAAYHDRGSTLSILGQ